MCHLFHLVKRENKYFIRGFATHEICVFSISLGELNGIFIQKYEYPLYICEHATKTRYLYLK